MSVADDLADLLRLLAEPTRLRLLRLCAEKPVSVGDLASAVHESLPSVSRHLRLLADGGLVRRSRDQRFTRYVTQRDGPQQAWIELALRQLDTDDVRARSEPLRPTSRLGAALAGVVDAQLLAVPHALERAVLHGRTYPEVFAVLQERAAVMLPSAQRWPAHHAPTLWVCDATAESAAHLPALCATAAAAMRAAAQFILMARYDTLELLDAGAHPLMNLRRLLANAGFSCGRIQPIEADAMHVLVVSGSNQSDVRAVAV